MAILKIAVLGNPVLRIPAEPVKNIQAPEIQRLIDDMIETMREYRGVGLAGPQVHRSLQIALIEAEERAEGSHRAAPPTVLINPRISPVTERMEEDWEGCLSIPDLRGRVPRYKEIEVQSHDRQGRLQTFKAGDFFARVIQHEVDHLNGTMFLDRMKSFESLSYLQEYARYWAPREEAG
ncbi:MAG TPA: peptide deformylase [Candidatus Methylomirabilis sp.]|nr:peptide deformylase [Candidatus Methylomirabilis sp.]